MLHVKPLARWRLALRLLARDWRAGEQRILVAALVIAVAASTAIGFFTDRLGRGMVNQSADFLGADLALVSPRPVDPAWLTQAGEWGLQLAETLVFASVVVSDDALQLAQVKAVQSGFPLEEVYLDPAASSGLQAEVLHRGLDDRVLHQGIPGAVAGHGVLVGRERVGHGARRERRAPEGHREHPRPGDLIAQRGEARDEREVVPRQGARRAADPAGLLADAHAPVVEAHRRRRSARRPRAPRSFLLT